MNKNPATSDNNTRNEPDALSSTEIVQNPNPKANENIRVRTDEPEAQNSEPAYGVGSEITDGEDA